MKIARNFIIGWILSLSTLHASPAEEQHLQELHEAELDLQVNPTTGLQKLRSLVNAIDKNQEPRAWILARALIEGEDGEPNFEERLAVWKKEADARGDKEGALRLIWRHVEVIWDRASKEQVMTLVDEAIQRACDGTMDAGFCGRSWGLSARYSYKIGDIPSGLQTIQKALPLLETLQGRSAVFYYGSRITLINLLNRVSKKDQGLELAEENLQWLTSHSFTFQAATTAGNLANSLLAVEPLDADRIVRLYDQSLVLAEEVDSKELIAYAFYGKGKLYRITKDNPKAEIYFAKGANLYAQTEMLDFAALCHISRALALIDLNRAAEAHQALESAAKLIAPDFEFEKIELLKARRTLAVFEEDYKTAFKVQKELFDAWRAEVEEKQKKNTESLTSELNLQIEEQRTKTLRQEADRFRLFILALSLLILAVLGLLVVARRQTLIARASEKKVRMILDNIDEGLLTVDASQRIGDDYSKHLSVFFGDGTSLGGRDFMKVVFGSSSLSGEQQSIVQEVLAATLGEARIAWDMNADHLPAEIQIGDDDERILALRWIPIFDEQDRLHRLLVSLLDVTQKRALERAFGSQKKHLQALPQSLQEIRQIKPERLQSLLGRTDVLMEEIGHAGAQTQLLRELHTQKGAARTLGVRTLSETLHDLETQLQTQTGRHTTGKSLQEAVRQVRERLSEYREMAKVLHEGPGAGLALEAPWMAAALGLHIQAWIEQMEEAKLPLQEFRVIDRVLKWDRQTLKVLPDLFLHSINNSLDHGFIRPQLKAASPRITVRAEPQGQHIRIEIVDNGVGLDWKRLEVLARARNFQPAPGETLANIVFTDGVTTADRLTVTSGRGIGLAAVKEQIEKIGGRLGIGNSEDGVGTLLWVEIPRESES